jgi:hypothetical protein
LTHTSGLDDPFVGSGFLAASGEQQRLAAMMRKWLPARLYEPGEVHLYSNFGYGLVGAVIEEVTGRRYEEFMRSEVLEPLGMNHSTFRQPLTKEIEQNVVPSLERSVFGFTRPAEIIYHRASSGGGLTTTLADLIRFVRFIQGGGSIEGRPILRSETLNRILGESGVDSAGESDSYGFSKGVNRGQKYWYAGGDLGGYHTILLWFPDRDRALITMAASTSNVATWNLIPGVMQSWFGVEQKAASVPVRATPNAMKFAARVAGIYRPLRYPHHDIAKTFLVSMDQLVQANDDGSIEYAGERWIAVEHLRFRNVADARELRRIRFLNRDSERIRWYQSGRAAIACYFYFLVVSLLILWRKRDHRKTRGVRWMAAVILIHSISWLGAVLVADPQRLILGSPWYLTVALGVGTLVPLAWLCLAASTCWGLFKRTYAPAHPLSAVLITLALGLYLPFISYWQLTALPMLQRF